MPSRPARPALLATAGALLASALLPLGTGTADAAPAAADDVLDILVLGDSYSAGNGATDDSGAAQTYGPAGCLRSKVNWGEKYAAALRAGGQQVRLVNHACSGGVTADVTNPRRMDTANKVEPTPAGVTTPAQAEAGLAQRDPCNTRAFPTEEFWTYRATSVTPALTTYECTRHLRPQADFVTPDVDLVLFTLGGNDAGFASIVQNCFVPLTRTSSGCKARVDAARALLPTIQERGLAAIAGLRAHGLRDDAKLVQLGYPYLQVDNDFTLSDPPGYPAGDQVRALVDEGNAAIAAIVPRANAGHPGQMTFLAGVPQKFAGHEPDASTPMGNPARWINQIGDGNAIEVFYHPNRLGHTAYADLLLTRGTFGATPGSEAVRARLRVRLEPDRVQVGDRVRLRVAVRLSDGSRPRGTVVVRDVTHDRKVLTRKLRRSDRGTKRLVIRPRRAGATELRIVYRDKAARVVRVTKRVRVVR